MRLRWLLAALALALVGCSRPGPDDRVLRLANNDDVRTLDTAIGYDINSWRFERLVYDGLLDYDSDGAIEPAIAEALPEVVDARRFTFRLRRGVRFHNGREVVAQDVKYAIERVLDPATTSPASGFFGDIVGAKAFVDGAADEVSGLRCPDPYTLVIELQQPDLAFVNVMTMPFAYPIPKEEVERWGDDWPQHAIGAGPYRLAEWVPGLRVRVERFEHYYRDSRGLLEAIEMRIGIPDFMQLMMFERGELDVTAIPLPDLERVQQDPRLRERLQAVPDNATYYLTLNCEMEPFTDKRVRQAFNYAVDRERILKIMAGTAVPAKGVLPPDMPGHNPDLVGYDHDPAKAKALLAAAGYPDGLAVELTTRATPTEQRWAEAVQADLREVGVEATIRPLSFSQWVDLAGKRGALPFSVSAWFMDYPDPSNFLDVLLNGDRITDTQSNNRAFYDNPRVNALLNRAATMSDYDARLKVYQEAERIIVDDAPWIFLYHPMMLRLVQPWVKGYEPHPVWSSTEDRTWFDPAAR